jgi:hypothetical protein
MAQPPPLEYAEQRAALQAYCHKYNISRPIPDYTFEWPAQSDHQSSPSPDISAVWPSVPAVDEEALEGNVYELPSISLSRDNIYDSRITNGLRLELSLLPLKSGPEMLRKFGPESLKKCSASIPTEVIDERDGGMDIPTDTDKITESLKKDMRITVTQDQAGYLREIIDRYTQDTSVDVILSKVTPHLYL